ncbi:MAG TPA: hypothetical protein VNB64_01505 [Solirubrobacteraceae bacterium]|nr:hypothetical protein [Solirubrobacteraceae bacterium]
MIREWVLAIAGLLALAGSASAAVPVVDIGAPSGPLTSVAVGNELGCQVKHTSDTVLEFYPSSTTPGDCGTLLAAGGTLYAPDFNAHGSTATDPELGTYTPLTPAGQSARTGAGTPASPFRVVTNATAGASGLAISQTDSYVVGQESYRTDVTVRNNGGAAQPIVLYRAGDCYLQNDDDGFGFTGPNNAIGCSATANNSPPGRIIEFVPITPGSSFLEDDYDDVWRSIATKAAFPSRCEQCANDVDNGAGISWTATLAPGQSATFSHFTTFSPAGRSGPPPPAPEPANPDIVAGRLPRCLSIPSVVRNRVFQVRGVGSVTLRTRQVDNPTLPLRLSLTTTGAARIASVVYTVNGRTVSSARAASVGIGSLRIGGRFVNYVVARVTLTNGRRFSITQRMVILRCSVPPVTCTRLANRTRMRCVSRTPGAGRRVRVTVTRSPTETGRGSATVVRGRYTVNLVSRTALGAGVYAYKAIVTTTRRGERLQMIRNVRVR